VQARIDAAVQQALAAERAEASAAYAMYDQLLALERRTAATQALAACDARLADAREHQIQLMQCQDGASRALALARMS